jgi:hypothetical protein
MGGKEHGQCKAFQSVRGAQIVNMWIQVLILPLFFLLTAVLPTSQQFFNTNRQTDLLDIVYPTQV